MRRISHDLTGVTQRIAKLVEEFEVSIDETKEVWRDAKGQAFFQQHTAEVRPTVTQLVSAMIRTNELFEEIARRVRDPDAT